MLWSASCDAALARFGAVFPDAPLAFRWPDLCVPNAASLSRRFAAGPALPVGFDWRSDESESQRPRALRDEASPSPPDKTDAIASPSTSRRSSWLASPCRCSSACSVSLAASRGGAAAASRGGAACFAAAFLRRALPVVASPSCLRLRFSRRGRERLASSSADASSRWPSRAVASSPSVLAAAKSHAPWVSRSAASEASESDAVACPTGGGVFMSKQEKASAQLVEIRSQFFVRAFCRWLGRCVSV